MEGLEKVVSPGAHVALMRAWLQGTVGEHYLSHYDSLVSARTVLSLIHTKTQTFFVCLKNLLINSSSQDSQTDCCELLKITPTLVR